MGSGVPHNPLLPNPRNSPHYSQVSCQKISSQLWITDYPDGSDSAAENCEGYSRENSQHKNTPCDICTFILWCVFCDTDTDLFVVDQFPVSVCIYKSTGTVYAQALGFKSYGTPTWHTCTDRTPGQLLYLYNPYGVSVWCHTLQRHKQMEHMLPTQGHRVVEVLYHSVSPVDYS